MKRALSAIHVVAFISARAVAIEARDSGLGVRHDGSGFAKLFLQA